ncbi:MAG: zf-HC2 domain-containing protein [Planctomycetota bacterium]
MAEAHTPPTTPDPGGSAPSGPTLPPECAALRGALHRRADREELTPSEAEALDAHLGGCEECVSELRRAGEFSTHVSKLLSGLKPPDDIRRKVLGRIGPLGGRRRMIVGAAALGGVALAGIVALVLSRPDPLARLSSTGSGVNVLAFSGGEWRSRSWARNVYASERVEATLGRAAILETKAGTIAVAAPALVQLEQAGSGDPDAVAVHCIRESSLLIHAPGGGSVKIVAGEVGVLVSKGSVVFKVLPDGRCRLEVQAGDARAVDASGERTVSEGETATLAQPAP